MHNLLLYGNFCELALCFVQISVHSKMFELRVVFCCDRLIFCHICDRVQRTSMMKFPVYKLRLVNAVVYVIVDYYCDI